MPRLILADDNIRDVGGHFYELATLLLDGASDLGYDGVLATHSSFTDHRGPTRRWPVHAVFHTRRLLRWSLGADGGSRLQRDFSGVPVGGTRLQNLWAGLADFAVRPSKRPARMLDQWAKNYSQFLSQVRPTGDDSLLINTGDDFLMLALASAMRRAAVPPLRIDALFHFAIYDVDQIDSRQRSRQFGQQLQTAVEALHPHTVHLHATTEALADQLRETNCGIPINAVPYPTRERTIGCETASLPLKAVLPGFPRAEKGREAIAELLAAADRPLLQSGNFRISMQMPARGWQTMVPQSLHSDFQSAVDGDPEGRLEVITSNLSTDAYHSWLDSANLGLFLYDPKRYVARCSGVLLEMLSRGIPVIVPDRCWLADQVRLAGGHRSVGLIYRDRSEIPALMQYFFDHREAMTAAATDYAPTLAARHTGRNTLSEMGILSRCRSSAA